MDYLSQIRELSISMTPGWTKILRHQCFWSALVCSDLIVSTLCSVWYVNTCATVRLQWRSESTSEECDTAIQWQRTVCKKLQQTVYSRRKATSPPTLSDSWLGGEKIFIIIIIALETAQMKEIKNQRSQGPSIYFKIFVLGLRVEEVRKNEEWVAQKLFFPFRCGPLRTIFDLK